MKLEELRKKNNVELEKYLISLYRERFKLLLEKSSGAEFTKNHLFKKSKKNIARVLTLISELKKQYHG